MNGKNKTSVQSSNRPIKTPQNGKEILDLYNNDTPKHGKTSGSKPTSVISPPQKDIVISGERRVAPPKSGKLLGSKGSSVNAGILRLSNSSSITGITKEPRVRLPKELHRSKTGVKRSQYDFEKPIVDADLHRKIGKHIMLSKMRSNSGVPVAYDAGREDIPVLEPHTESHRDGKLGLVGVVEGSDFCTELTVSSTDLPGSVLYTQQLNPHAILTSRLNNQALNWQKFHFEMLEFVFISAQGTDGDGQIVSTIFTDPLDELATDGGASNIEEALANYGNVAISNIWEKFSMSYENDSKESDLYTDETMSSDIRLTSNGVFQIISNTAFGSPMTLGMIYMNYRVRFSQPTLPSGASSIKGGIWGNIGLDVGNPTDTSPFGDADNPPPLLPSTVYDTESNINIEPIFHNGLGAWAWYLPRGHWRIFYTENTASTPSPVGNLSFLMGPNVIEPTFETELYALGNTATTSTYTRVATQYYTSRYMQCVEADGINNYIAPFITGKTGGGTFYCILAITATHEWLPLPFLDTFISNNKDREDEARIGNLEKEMRELRSNLGNTQQLSITPRKH